MTADSYDITAQDIAEQLAATVDDEPEATWQCPECNTWNGIIRDQTCMVCDHPKGEQQ